MIRTVLLALIAVLGAGWSATALAQDEDPRIPRARELFEQGEAHHADRRYLLAAEAFQQAYDLMTEAEHPNAGMILFNLGASYEAIPGREQDALDAYQRFLREAPGGQEPVQELISTVQDRIRELERRMETARPDESEGGGLSPLGPIVMAIGGAAIVAGAITGGVTLGEDASLADVCGEDGRCPPSARSQAEGLETLALTTDILLFGGAATAVAGLVLTLVLRDGDGGDPDSARLVPSCSLAACGASLEGRF